ncbi:proprotein convertase P-domain-containing protein [Lysobacter antibioticus]|uniref:Leupeptin-inactivating enzyme 1 domain protein n=1 Tax=Lysobacter antibioticus TaxID=84531 RepID=A0A0S2F4J2_LYSAN|nr:proprotein convertase P-domain-containing protein [Lysobacter antibioticus]ALN78365.1 leupeptin-inactivating enzyme 1 domain protein [Lysobacter antibioticus]
MKSGTTKFFAPTLLAIALTSGLALSFAPEAVAADPAPAPLKIAEQRSTDLRLGAGGKAAFEPVEIRTPDAAFIKVHFERLSLPEGVMLEVASPDGREVYRYGNTQRDRYTVAKDLGQDGRLSFSAMSIGGPVAVLRLVGTPREPWNSGHGVVVTRYLEGYPEAMLGELQDANLLGGQVGTKSICGVDDKKAAACYASSDAAAFDRSRPVARMLSSGGSLCTAWRVGPDNRMFTNNHCINTAAAVAGAEFWFNYQLSSCGGAQGTVTKVAGDQMLRTDATLDYTLFTVKNFATISSFGYLGLDVRAATAGEGLFISGHPGGRLKELSVVDDRNGGGSCRVDSANVNGNGTNTDIGYYCDTEGGSSGSPVIARSTRKAIALHHFGGCLNSGAKFSLIWPQVSTHFGGVVPDGDDGGGTPAPRFENTSDYAINDNATVDSPVTVSGISGTVLSVRVEVAIVHTYQGDLKVDLVAPDGTLYNLHNRTGGSADNINKVYTVPVSELANGVWKLRVNDNAAQDVGKIDRWALQF